MTHPRKPSSCGDSGHQPHSNRHWARASITDRKVGESESFTSAPPRAGTGSVQPQPVAPEGGHPAQDPRCSSGPLPAFGGGRPAIHEIPPRRRHRARLDHPLRHAVLRVSDAARPRAPAIGLRRNMEASRLSFARLGLVDCHGVDDIEACRANSRRNRPQQCQSERSAGEYDGQYARGVHHVDAEHIRQSRCGQVLVRPHRMPRRSLRRRYRCPRPRQERCATRSGATSPSPALHPIRAAAPAPTTSGC